MGVKCLPNKKSLCLHNWDKSLHFCGTTQIDDKSPSRLAYYHMHPTDNGQGSRQRLLSLRFRTALASPFSMFRYAALPPAAALWDTFPYLLLSLIGFSFCGTDSTIFFSRRQSIWSI